MRQAFLFALFGITLVAVLALSGGVVHSNSAQGTQGTGLPPELPPDTTPLQLDKPLTASLDPKTTIHFYTFAGKAGQLIRISVEPKSGNFYTTLTIMSEDLDTILGGTIGEALVSGSVVVKLPDDATYAISVEYADSTIGTPTPGQYEIVVSSVKPQ
jgi:hypothetical protein